MIPKFRHKLTMENKSYSQEWYFFKVVKPKNGITKFLSVTCVYYVYVQCTGSAPDFPHVHAITCMYTKGVS